MKRMMCVMLCLCLAAVASAGLSITNGDFETNAPTSGTNTWDVDSWYDTYPTADGQTNNWWWEGTWYGDYVSPTGSSVMGLSYMYSTNWAYQSIGVNDEGLTELVLSFDVGSFTDAGEDRDLGVTISVYESDGTFTGADESDIADATTVTLIDSVDILETLSAGDYVTVTITLDLTSAGDGELFLRFENYAGTTGTPWVAIDNVSIVPEPATLALLGLGGLLAGRKRRVK